MFYKVVSPQAFVTLCFSQMFAKHTSEWEFTRGHTPETSNQGLRDSNQAFIEAIGNALFRAFPGASLATSHFTAGRFSLGS